MVSLLFSLHLSHLFWISKVKWNLRSLIFKFLYFECSVDRENMFLTWIISKASEKNLELCCFFFYSGWIYAKRQVKGFTINIFCFLLIFTLFIFREKLLQNSPSTRQREYIEPVLHGEQYKFWNIFFIAIFKMYLKLHNDKYISSLLENILKIQKFLERHFNLSLSNKVSFCNEDDYSSKCWSFHI